MSAFDIDIAIAEFLVDPTRASLCLPHMTTGQRKQTKKLAEKHADLKCESYGFGSERQLHIFKMSRKVGAETVAIQEESDQAGPLLTQDTDCGAVMNAVSVKNTFIDGWIACEEFDEALEPIIFRSLPVGLPKSLLYLGSNESGRTQTMPPSDEGLQEIKTRSAVTRDVCSTAASSAASSASEESPALQHREMLALPEDFRIRNTFIHFDSSPIDERIVQTMPHDMFSQCLQAEECKEAAPTTWDPALAKGAEAALQFLPGTEVVVEGLVKCPAFNGLCGIVQLFDKESARYSVLLALSANQSGYQLAQVKGDNLRLSTVPPPPEQCAPEIIGASCDTSPPSWRASLPISPTAERVCAR